jgi:hypothetical protein
MAIGIELARVIGPLTPFPRKVLNAKSAIRDKNRHIKAHDQGFEKTRYSSIFTRQSMVYVVCSM